MKAASRLMRLIQVAMLLSMALYVGMGEMVSRSLRSIPANPLFHAFSLISITLVAATVVIRRTLVLPSEAALLQKSDDRPSLSRWKTSLLVIYGLCEILPLFGFVLRISGFTLANVWGFYLGGFVLLLLYSPGIARPQEK